MDILLRSNPDNYDKVRGRTSSLKPQSSKASSMFSTKSLVLYHERMELTNNLGENINIEDNSPQLFYVMLKEKENHVSIVADSNNNTMDKHVLIEHPTLSTFCVDNTAINIQLPYDLNTSIESELWDESFHSISLHGSIKYLASDSKSIKNLLNNMAKYITNKQVDLTKSNDLEDFKGINKTIWNLIFSIY